MSCIKCDVNCNDVIICANLITLKGCALESVVHDSEKFVTKRLNYLRNISFLFHSVLSTLRRFLAKIYS
jgi:hypothetical protein